MRDCTRHAPNRAVKVPALLFMDKEEKKFLITSVPFWFHSIDCGDGLITPGQKSVEVLARESEFMKLPDLRGKSVLDVGAWDGWFSFQAKKLGANRVLALDHYIWSMDVAAQQSYFLKCREQGIAPKPYHLIPGHWQPGALPGKRGFDTAHRIIGSDVEQIVADFMTCDLVSIGQFDIVFFLGVLYHLEEPFTALKRLRLITKEVAIIETAAIFVPGQEDVALLEFYESDGLSHDVGNWFAPNMEALAGMCRAAGFSSVEVTSPYPVEAQADEMVRYRLTVHART